MILEYAVVELTCDIKSCNETERVQAQHRDQCNRQLFENGWRMYRNNQLCPFHVRQRERKQSEASEPFAAEDMRRERAYRDGQS